MPSIKLPGPATNMTWSRGRRGSDLRNSAVGGLQCLSSEVPVGLDGAVEGEMERSDPEEYSELEEEVVKSIMFSQWKARRKMRLNRDFISICEYTRFYDKTGCGKSNDKSPAQYMTHENEFRIRKVFPPDLGFLPTRPCHLESYSTSGG